MDVMLIVNGANRRLALDPRTTLLDALRDHLGLTGSKKGCDQGQCGACTVLVDGRRVLGCLTLAAAVQGTPQPLVAAQVAREDAAGGLDRQVHERPLEDTAPAVAESDEAVPVHLDAFADDGPDDGVESRAVPAPGEHPDLHSG